MFQYAKQKQTDAAQAKLKFQEEQQALARVSILKAAEDRERKFKEMELATVDGARKKVQLNAWNQHWQDLAQETYLTQEIQIAQQKA